MTEQFDLRRARINAGLTQRALAAKANVPLITVQNLEGGGGANTRPANLKRLADFFEVKATDLLRAEDVAA